MKGKSTPALFFTRKLRKAHPTDSEENSLFLLLFAGKGINFEAEVLPFTLQEVRFRVHAIYLTCILLLLIFW